MAIMHTRTRVVVDLLETSTTEQFGVQERSRMRLVQSAIITPD